MKRCTKCGERKNEVDFPRDKSRKDGLDTHCRDCHLACSAAHRAERAAYQRAHYASHRDERAAYRRAYSAKRPRRDNASYNATYYKKHGEEIAVKRYFMRLGVTPTPELLTLKTQHIKLIRATKKAKEAING